VHASIVTVNITDMDQAMRMLREDIVPRVAQAPGFVAGYWFAPRDADGGAVILWESEEAARAGAARVRERPPGPAEIVDIDIREVIAQA